jgi:transcriptional regulator with XRE-family HTH domain
MSIIGDKMRELRGSSSQREMADAIGIKYNAWARYEAGGALPGAEIIERICRVHACSADWLLGLKDNAAPTANARGKGAIAVAGSNNAVNTGGDCSKCKLMKAHLREITGRKK